MQSLASSSSPARPTRPTIFSTARYILAVDGWRGLFRGVTPRIGLSVWRVRPASSRARSSSLAPGRDELSPCWRADHLPRLARRPRQEHRQEGRRRERAALSASERAGRRRRFEVETVIRLLVLGAAFRPSLSLIDTRFQKMRRICAQLSSFVLFVVVSRGRKLARSNLFSLFVSHSSPARRGEGHCTHLCKLATVYTQGKLLTPRPCARATRCGRCSPGQSRACRRRRRRGLRRGAR